MEPDGKNRAGKQYTLVVKCIGFGINLSLGEKKKNQKGTAFSLWSKNLL